MLNNTEIRNYARIIQKNEFMDINVARKPHNKSLIIKNHQNSPTAKRKIDVGEKTIVQNIKNTGHDNLVKEAKIKRAKAENSLASPVQVNRTIWETKFREKEHKRKTNVRAEDARQAVIRVKQERKNSDHIKRRQSIQPQSQEPAQRKVGKKGLKRIHAPEQQDQTGGLRRKLGKDRIAEKQRWIRD